MDKVPASSLGRNSQVVLDPDEMPYLVDSVSDLPGGKVQVTYSSGDIVEYAADEELSVLD